MKTPASASYLFMLPHTIVLRALVAIFVCANCSRVQIFRWLLEAFDIRHTSLGRKHTGFYGVDFEPFRSF